MCAAAMSFARIRRLYFGAGDPKGGAVENGVRFFAQPTCHHRPEVYGGINESECAALLKEFFQARRLPRPSCPKQRHAHAGSYRRLPMPGGGATATTAASSARVIVGRLRRRFLRRCSGLRHDDLDANTDGAHD